MDGVIGADLLPLVEAFLARRGIPGSIELKPVAGGANNRVYRLDTAAGPFLLKHYFSSPSDQRDRFGAERGFYDIAAAHDIRSVPQPFDWNPYDRVGILEFIDGAKPEPHQISKPYVDQATEFLTELNTAAVRVSARSFTDASEACFSVTSHLERVQTRIGKLQNITISSDIDSMASAWLSHDLLPAWKFVSTKVREAAPPNQAHSYLLPQNQRILSPSDFGFHNALVDSTQRLRFFDFEYAGWDDPAKTICDFFCQPKVPVPLGFFESFASAVSDVISDDSLVSRSLLLLPVFRLKWCCIQMNDFLVTDGSRRQFSLGSSGIEERKRDQLELARQSLRFCLDQLPADWMLLH